MSIKDSINEVVLELLIFSVFAFMPNNLFCYYIAILLITLLIGVCIFDMTFVPIIQNMDEDTPLFLKIISKIILYSIFIILIYTKEYAMLTFLTLACLYITLTLKIERKSHGNSTTPSN